MLSPYRVIDLTTERGLLCGQILGDLGADVIKIEPPGGATARGVGPFYGERPDPNRSLFWWAYNRNKRGVTLDIEREEGRALLRRLVERADFLIESENPGHLAALGLGHEDLASVNPRLVYVSITPFGQDGPKAGYLASDLVILAAGGFLALTGDEDRPPVRVSLPQAFHHASADAAAAALIANHERQRSGRGQHVDVSAQQSMMPTTFSTALSAPLDWPPTRRLAGGFRYGPFVIPGVFKTRDGYVAITFLFGSAIGPMTRRLMELIHEEGFCDEATRDKDWVGYADLLFKGKEPVEELRRVQEIVRSFVKTKTKAELLQAALDRHLLVAPINTIDEVAQSEQLAAREYWRDLMHPELGTSVRYPGPFAKFGATPIPYRRRPPLIGEHNHEVFANELGLREDELAALEREGIV